MKPEKRRERSRAAAAARGRMYLKDRLGWLPGFPVGQAEGVVHWMSVPRERPPEAVTLDRDHLRRATFAWSKLARRFPRALPRIVKEHERWASGVPRLLERLKAAIHQGQTLPESLFASPDEFPAGIIRLADSIAREHPALEPLLAAMSWRFYLATSELADTLAWLKTHAAQVASFLESCGDTPGVIAAMTLARLALEAGEVHVDALLHLLADARVFSVPMDEGAEQLVECASSMRRQAQHDESPGPLPSPPAPQLGRELLAFVEWLARTDRKDRRRALGLFALLLPDDLCQRWQDWWDAARAAANEAWRSVGPAARGGGAAQPQTKKNAEAAHGRLEQALHNAPPRHHARRLLSNVRTISTEWPKLFRETRRTLQRLPRESQNGLVRAALLDHVLRLTSTSGKLGRLLKVFRRFLSAPVEQRLLLAPWADVVRRWNWQGSGGVNGSFFYKLLGGDDLVAPPALWPAVFAAVARCAALERPLDADQAETLAKLVHVTGSDETATSRFLELVDEEIHDEWLDVDVLRLAHLADPGRAAFGKLAAFLDRCDADPAVLLEVAKRLRDSGWTNVAGNLVLESRTSELERVGRQVSAVRSLRESPLQPPAPSLAAPPAWSTRYPVELQNCLARLQAVDANAQRTAKRILSRQFPDPADVERELAAIEPLLKLRPHDDKLAQRHANLSSRLSALSSGRPPRVSPARMANLAGKLNRTTESQLLEYWRRRLDGQLRGILARRLGVSDAPDWMLAPPQLRVVAGVLGLEPSFRRLATRLFRLRCGPPPWDLADEPPNREFLAGLAEQGVDTGPWLHPCAPREFTGKNGRRVWLSFEADPLEVFQMGAHFHTCLSPGQCNFFSVFANAADINKHVVYARDHRGQVVGRCLLALTNHGGLLTFLPYCHEVGLGFAEMVQQLAEDLAGRMGAAVVPRGAVDCLVASDWYDDGPHDLGGRFAFLEDGAAFRASLAHVSEDALLEQLRSQFEPLSINSLTLPLILSLPEFENRPRLILPLLEAIETCGELADDVWLRAADLAHRAGAADFAHRVLRDRAVPFVLKRWRENGYPDETAVRLLVALTPSVALRVLRRTRDRGVRADEQETNAQRRRWLADCHEALGRSAQARRLR